MTVEKAHHSALFKAHKVGKCFMGHGFSNTRHYVMCGSALNCFSFVLLAHRVHATWFHPEVWEAIGLDLLKRKVI